MKKKILSILLTGVLLVSVLTGCGEKASTGNGNDTQTESGS